jgi:hypothetical protein
LCSGASGLVSEEDKSVDEQQATTIAEALGGSAWQSDGGIWLVLLRRSDGRLVVISDEVVCEYKNEDCFEKCNPQASIPLH